MSTTLRERVIEAGRAAWETYNDGSTNVYDQEDAVALAGARAALEKAVEHFRTLQAALQWDAEPDLADAYTQTLVVLDKMLADLSSPDVKDKA